jgi:hypothetical protein
MPLHDLRCDSCGKIFEAILPGGETCSCGAVAKIIFLTPPRVRGDYSGYTCQVTGKWVEGRKAHRENLAATGCRVLEPGEKEAVAKRRQASEASLDRDLGESVERYFESLPSDKLERLGNEIAGGANLGYERS